MQQPKDIGAAIDTAVRIIDQLHGLEYAARDKRTTRIKLRNMIQRILSLNASDQATAE